MAIGKIYDADELKRINDLLELKDAPYKQSDEAKYDLNKKVFDRLILISSIVVFILGVSFIAKRK